MRSLCRSFRYWTSPSRTRHGKMTDQLRLSNAMIVSIFVDNSTTRLPSSLKRDVDGSEGSMDEAWEGEAVATEESFGEGRSWRRQAIRRGVALALPFKRELATHYSQWYTTPRPNSTTNPANPSLDLSLQDLDTQVLQSCMHAEAE